MEHTVVKSPNGRDVLEFTSSGFELYVPPTQIAPPSLSPTLQFAQFVMLDDQNDVFYGVDYEHAQLKNTTPWLDVALHRVVDPAIVFPPSQAKKLEEGNGAVGFLVSIQSRDGGVFTAIKRGAMYVIAYPEHVMNWGALESLKGPELPAEMRVGLLRHLYNRRLGASAGNIPYVTPRSALDKMSRPWHRVGSELNWQLDSKFAGCSTIPKEQKWRVHAT